MAMSPSAGVRPLNGQWCKTVIADGRRRDAVEFEHAQARVFVRPPRLGKIERKQVKRAAPVEQEMRCKLHIDTVIPDGHHPFARDRLQHHHADLGHAGTALAGGGRQLCIAPS
jgi:hypothetical protein